MFNPYYSMSAQQVATANGKASIDKIVLPPNSSVFVMDTTAPMIWLCVSDSLGNVSSTPYDIKEHIEPNVVTKQGVEERLTALEEMLGKLMEGKNESNVITVKPKQVRKSDPAD